MKTAKHLKISIDIFFAFLIVTLAGSIIAPIVFYIKEKEAVNVGLETFNEMGLTTTHLIVAIFVGLLISVLFIIGILNLRKTMKFMTHGDYFSEKVTTNFKSAGTLFVIVGSLGIIVPLILMLFVISNINVGMATNYNFGSSMPTNSPLFTIIIGLFFILMSYVFTQARLLKQENDLTI